MLGEAPLSSNSCTISGWRSEMAHINAVLLVSAVAALTSAPLLTSACTTSVLPVRAAVISGVRPLVWAESALAPAASNR